ncbi:hypothetical protein [Rhodoligotrophos defluvii]|uniref:hypothetical protein n=1 Tax=Rhodoligotrophos defluvii TaxID=2561934 RepID=UPI0010C99E61|nr:hypothetical protein [Rhodoligotrophos defluvii]
MANPYAERWRNYRPSKAAWFWSCVAAVVLTMIIGFSWGGWVTGGTARDMADTAAEEARAQLAATVCVDRFMDAADARTQLAALKETSSWERDSFIEEGGWATLPGMDEPVEASADLCAERLAEMQLPPSGATADAPQPTTVQ